MRSAYLICLLGACSFEHGARSGDTVDGRMDTPSDEWWDAAWSARRSLTIKNGSTSETLSAGFQVGFTVQLATSPCTGRDDVRVIYRHTTEIERVVDEIGTSTVWFKLMSPIAPGESSTDYFVYCGNPAPDTAPSNASEVFDFFEGFDAPLDTAVWTTKAMAVPTSGSLVVGNGAQTDNGIVSVARYTAGHATDFIARPSQATEGKFWAGFQNGTLDQAPWIMWWTNKTTIIAPAFKVNGVSEDWRGMSKPLDTQPHLFTVENFGEHAIFRFDNTNVETHTYDVAPPASFSIRLWNYNTTPTVAFDMVRVRQVIDPAPTVTLGAVETRL